MPFSSKSQMRGAFSGALGPEMQAKAPSWAHETPNLKNLPVHVSSPRGSHKPSLPRLKKPSLMSALRGLPNCRGSQ